MEIACLRRGPGNMLHKKQWKYKINHKVLSLSLSLFLFLE
jgi:hypothetical protein